MMDLTSTNRLREDEITLSFMQCLNDNNKKDIYIACEDCTDNASTCYCQNCDSNLCEECFNNIHSRKIFQKHKKCPLPQIKKSSSKPSQCEKHEKAFEFFCAEDQIMICSHCFIVGDHKNHYLKPIKDHNQQMLPTLKVAIEKVLEVKKRREQTQESETEKAARILKRYKSIYQQGIEYFDLCQAALNESEITFTTNLKNSFEEYGEKVLAQGSTSIDKLNSILEDAEKVIKDPHLTLNITHIINEFEEIIESDKEMPNLAEPQVIFNHDLQKSFHSLAQVTIPIKASEPVESELDDSKAASSSSIKSYRNEREVERTFNNRPEIELEATPKPSLLFGRILKSPVSDASDSEEKTMPTPRSPLSFCTSDTKEKTLLPPRSPFRTSETEEKTALLPRSPLPFGRIGKDNTIAKSHIADIRPKKREEKVLSSDPIPSQVVTEKVVPKPPSSISGKTANSPFRLPYECTQLKSSTSITVHETLKPIPKKGTSTTSLYKPNITEAGDHCDSLHAAPVGIGQKHMYIKDIEIVEVCYIDDPSTFYVVTLENKVKLTELQNRIHEWTQEKKFKETVVTNPLPGEIYLAPFSVDQNYYRAQVEKIISNEQGRMVKVIYIDYGNIELISVNCLKMISPEDSEVESKIKKCCLYDINPKGGAWSKEAIADFITLVAKQQVQMLTLERREDLLFVDLKLYSPNARECISVRDQLIITSQGFFPTGNTSEAVLSKKPPPPPLPSIKEIKIEPLVLEKEVEALITLVESPQNFYIQLQLNTAPQATKEFFAKIQTFYKRFSTHSHFKLLNPVEGQACVVLDSKDNMWYRARIISKFKDCLSVEFVDYGYAVNLSLSAIRKIKDEFLTQPALAYCCSIDDWRPAANNDQINTKFIELVKNKAVYVTPLSLKRDHTYNVAVSMIYDEEKRSVMDVFLDLHPSDDEFEESDQEAMEVDEEEIERVESPYIPVTITYCVNPSYFIVQLSSDEKANDYQKLMNQMFRSYSKISYKAINVIESITYAVFSDFDEKWHRGRIIKTLAHEQYEVFMVDIGHRESVIMEHIRPLSNELKEIDPFAVKCHIKDLYPFESTTEWNPVATEYLDHYKNARKVVYLQFLGEVEDDSYPVAIYEQKKIKNEIKYISLGDVFINGGLALPMLSGLKPNPMVYMENCLFYKEAMIPQDQYFCVRPTHLDNYGNLYVQNTSEIDNLHKIIAELRLKTCSYNMGYPDIDYLAGQACVAKYDYDGKWYRAEILPQHSERTEVLFVDYGNKRIIDDPRQNIYPDVVCIDIPKQVFKCRISSITTKNEWPASTVEFIKSTIVGRPSKAIVIDPSENGSILGVTMMLPNGEILSDLVKEFEENTDEDKDGDLSSPFTALKIDSTERIQVIVPQTGKDCHVYIQRLEVQEPTTQLHYRINDNHQRFMNLLNALQENNFAPLKNISTNLPCCAKSVNDECWYRALIGEVLKDSALVFYVDYGNVEEIPLENIRSLPKNLVDFPSQAIICKLYGVEKNCDNEILANELMECFLELDLVAIIKTLEPEVEIELRDKDGRLPYQCLIDARLIKNKRGF